jgi:hypothetical protein
MTIVAKSICDQPRSGVNRCLSENVNANGLVSEANLLQIQMCNLIVTRIRLHLVLCTALHQPRRPLLLRRSVIQQIGVHTHILLFHI